MSAHTPGPWFVGAQNDALYITVGKPPAPDNDYPVHDADRTPLAKVYDVPEVIANARLIAAAPDTKDSLKAMLQRVDCPCHTEDEWCDGCRAVLLGAKAAIAAAEGRAE